MAVTILTPADGATVSTSPGIISCQVQVPETDILPSEVLDVKVWSGPVAQAPGSYAAAWSFQRDVNNGTKWNGSVSVMTPGQYAIHAYVRRQEFSESATTTITAANP